MKLPLEERKLQTRKEFLDDIAMSLGGYVAEKLIFGDVTTGPSSDLQVASRLARAMVTKWGMSDKIGPVALEGHDSEVVYGRGFGEKEYSPEVNAIIDSEVKKIIDDSLKVAEGLITEKRNVLEAIANALMEKESLEQKEYNEIIQKFGIEPKKLPERPKNPPAGGDPKPEFTDVISKK
jgi:cell division protease FtsH